MAKNGYVKIYRSLEDDILWKSDEPFNYRDAWIDLILQANYADSKFLFNRNDVVVHRGQIFTSVR